MSVVGPIAAKKLQGRECSEVVSLQQNSLVIRSSRPHRRTPAIRGTGVTEYWIDTAASFRLDVSGPDHLAPLLGFIGDEPAEIGGPGGQGRALNIRPTRPPPRARG